MIMASKEIWDARIVTYLYLAGMGSGAYGSVTLLDLLRVNIPASMRTGAAGLGFLLVLGGIAFLLADLGHPLRFLRVLGNPTSVITYGAWILSLFLVAAFVDVISGALQNQAGELIIVLLSLGVAGYTGFLLGVINARPFWNTPLLPILFIVSAVSTGLAANNLLSIVMISNRDAVIGPVFVGMKESLIWLELILVVIYLFIMNNATIEAKLSVAYIVKGELRNVFWLGVVGCGLLIPALAELLWSGYLSVIVSSILVVVGGFCLRHIILRAGIRTLLPGENWQLGLS